MRKKKYQDINLSLQKKFDDLCLKKIIKLKKYTK